MAQFSSSYGLRPTLSGNPIPIGGKVDYPADKPIPEGYLSCLGQTFNYVDYPALYSILGSSTLPNDGTVSGYIKIMKAKDAAIGGIADADSMNGKLSSYYEPITNRNRIINGEMMITQRFSTSAMNALSNTYTLDRWYYNCSQNGKYNAQRNLNGVTPPDVFQWYLGFSVASAVTVGASDYFNLRQSVEGYNIRDLSFGTAKASAVTLSFWVQSSVTGTFSGSIRNGNYTRSYPFTYVIPQSNTWTHITVTIPGDTSGTWTNNSNTIGLSVNFNLGAGSSYLGTAGVWSSSNYTGATGSVSLVGTAGATFYVTGVQLEKGAYASPFEFLEVTELIKRCLRYYEVGGGVFFSNIAQAQPFFSYMVLKRVTPTVSVTVGTGTGGTVIPFGNYGVFQNSNHSINSTFTWAADAEL